MTVPMLFAVILTSTVMLSLLPILGPPSLLTSVCLVTLRTLMLTAATTLTLLTVGMLTTEIHPPRNPSCERRFARLCSNELHDSLKL